MSEMDGDCPRSHKMLPGPLVARSRFFRVVLTHSWIDFQMLLRSMEALL